MPRYNVRIGNKWACYSTICDGFVSEVMSLEDYEKWRDEQYGKQKEPLETCNQIELHEALEQMIFYCTDKEFVDKLVEARIIQRGDDDE